MPSLEQDTESELLALVGTTVAAKYRIERLIGRGGMGAVFQAQNLAIGKRVALKFLDREAAEQREASLRFQREAEAASMAESAHIVQIFDSGVTESGLPFLVMELLTGEDLRARLQREQRLSPEQTLRIASQVLRALVGAHRAGIVHRDLKPDNVFLCARDDDPAFVKLVDFGISKVARTRPADTLTRRGTVLGTAFYMSPEQAQSIADIDGRTDLFSLGAILFEMLTGRPPHEGRTYEAVLIAICTHDAPDVRASAPDVPEAVAALVARALARDRSQRFQSASDFLEAIAALDHPRGAPRATRRFGTLVGAIVATLAGFLLTAYLVARGQGPAAAHNEAEPPKSAQTRSTEPSAALVQVTPVPLPLTSAAALPPATSKPASGKTPRPPAPKPSARVPGGLQLSTKEP